MSVNRNNLINELKN